MKSQILAGGRGLGKFTNGFQGGVHIVHKDKVSQRRASVHSSSRVRVLAGDTLD